MYRFTGEVFGRLDEPTLVELLETWTRLSLRQWATFRTPEGRPLPPLDESQIMYIDPVHRDPPLQDAATTWLNRGGACGSLAVYLVSEIRFAGFEASFDIVRKKHEVPEGDKLVLITEWHVRVRRQNGTIDDVSRRRGMKG